MIPAVEAEEIILANLQEPNVASECLPVEQGLGRVLASNLSSPSDFPHWDNSAMDGYAVRYEDVQLATRESPVSLSVVEEIPAGKAPQQILQKGQAARILTGSMMPEGADSIVIQEVTQLQEQQVRILEAPRKGQFVRQQGSYCHRGDQLLMAGTVLGAAEIAVMAAAQQAQVSVFRRPRVAILSTGDELARPDQPLKRGQIVDSNQYALAALVRQVGAEPICLGIIKDDPEPLQGAIAQAVSQSDLVLSSGGVSVGDYDYVDDTLKALGAKILITAVAVKPGKPLTVAKFDQTEPGSAALYFGLPGNPVSALVSFWRFVAPALRKLSGRSPSWSPVFLPAKTRQRLTAGGQRETYIWGRLATTEIGCEFAPAAGGHGSGNLINLVNTNGLAVIPAGTTEIPAGSSMQVLQTGDLFSSLIMN